MYVNMTLQKFISWIIKKHEMKKKTLFTSEPPISEDWENP